MVRLSASALRRPAILANGNAAVTPVLFRKSRDGEVTPVLFRKSRDGEVTAVFPCEVASTDDASMGCFSHIGQHGACSLDWYRTTRPASLSEYADLKTELESPPYHYRLKVYRRMTGRLYAIFGMNLLRLISAGMPR